MCSSFSTLGQILVSGRYYIKDVSLERHQVLESISGGTLLSNNFIDEIVNGGADFSRVRSWSASEAKAT
jgi:hypothetical protein